MAPKASFATNNSILVSQSKSIERLQFMYFGYVVSLRGTLLVNLKEARPTYFIKIFKDEFLVQSIAAFYHCPTRCQQRIEVQFSSLLVRCLLHIKATKSIYKKTAGSVFTLQSKIAADQFKE